MNNSFSSWLMFVGFWLLFPIALGVAVTALVMLLDCQPLERYRSWRRRGRDWWIERDLAHIAQRRAEAVRDIISIRRAAEHQMRRIAAKDIIEGGAWEKRPPSAPARR